MTPRHDPAPTLRERLIVAATRAVRATRGSNGPAGWAVHQLDRYRAGKAEQDPGLIAAVLAAFADAYPRAIAIEVGANDGIKRDPLRRYLLTRPWRAYLLEPAPQVYATLCRNVRYLPGVVPVNVAIGESDGSQPFFHVRPPQPGEPLWRWHDALGSFDRDVVLSHTDLIPDIADRLIETEVPTVTFSTFLREHDIQEIDLLHIDTEGYDLQVLSQVDLDRLSPALVIYEHHHLDAADVQRARGLLLDAGYATAEEGLDTMAVRISGPRPASPEFLAAWDRLVEVTS